MTTPKPQALVTEQEVARRLGLQLTQVKNWRKNFKGPPQIRFGRTVVYSESDIRKFIADAKQNPA